MLKLRIKQKIFSFATAVGLLGFVLFPNSAQAQVQVSPLLISTETKQGKAAGVITLTNSGNQEVRMRLEAQAFTYGLNGFQTLESSENDLSPYIRLSPKEVVLQPGETRRIRFLSLLLPSMELAEYRAVIFSQPLKEKVTIGLNINARIGTVVYVRHGKSIEKLTPVETSYDTQKKELKLLVKNEGNVTVRPKGKWSLTQGGKEVFQGQMSTITVIAEGGRNIPIRVKEGEEIKPIPSGDYQLTGELIWGNSANPTTVPFSLPVTIP